MGYIKEFRQSQDCLVKGYIWFYSKEEIRIYNRNYYILFMYSFGVILSL